MQTTAPTHKRTQLTRVTILTAIRRHMQAMLTPIRERTWLTQATMLIPIRRHMRTTTSTPTNNQTQTTPPTHHINNEIGTAQLTVFSMPYPPRKLLFITHHTTDVVAAVIIPLLQIQQVRKPLTQITSQLRQIDGVHFIEYF